MICIITGSATVTSGFSEIDEALPSEVRGVSAVLSGSQRFSAVFSDSNEAIVDQISSRTEFDGGLTLVLDIAVFRDPRRYRRGIRRQVFHSNGEQRGANAA